ncbi:hypothetical protein [Acetobacter ghanensis]|uniref:Uncharacterized protein n=1 Tax=Acetobacter ghanensis TaxID=431306 RepID=A0A0U5F1J8_9PROT|nr:hypothetical protein [Acetobacter ghanensis]NHO39445.1 hypothetical protein [Acetobacter ghanensis]CEF54587.1 hypothetical protein predicted by Glimmer/Critica [Acetobacter ghanensis]
MSESFLISLAICAVSATALSRIVGGAYWRQSFILEQRISAMKRHNEALDELLSDAEIGDDIKEAVCRIGEDCFTEVTAISLLDELKNMPTPRREAGKSGQAPIISDAIGTALDVAVTFAAAREVIPEKKRVFVMRNPLIAAKAIKLAI